MDSSKFILITLIISLFSGIANANWLSAKYYTDVTSCASGETANAFIAMDKCIQVRLSIYFTLYISLIYFTIYILLSI
jgi:hypothetical protein